jgi:hypothetical protein
MADQAARCHSIGEKSGVALNLTLVYNLMRSFQRDCLPKGYRTMSFATVLRHFLEHAIEIEDRGEGTVLIFNTSYPLQRTANWMLRKR